MSKFFSFLVLCLFLFSLAGCRPAVKSNTLVVGTNAEYPPYCFYEGEKIVGFDIDVIREIGRRLQKDILIKDLSFDALLPALQVGQVDVLAAGMSATPTRAQRVSFTRPHLVSDPLVLVSDAQSPISSPEKLQGLSLVVNDGYVAELYANTWKGVHLIRLASPADAFLALQSKRAHAFFTAKNTFLSYIHKNPDHNLVSYPVEELYEGVSFAVAKNQPERLQQIQDALDAMDQEGTLQQLRERWRL